MKKVLSLILSIVMLLSACVGADIFAFAQSSGKCGVSVSYTFNDTTGTVIISGEGAMANYFSSSENASPFDNNKTVKEVIIKKGVTSVGDCAFIGCQNLSKITIPDTVEYIGVNAFKRCYSLNKITLPQGVTDIARCAFTDSGINEINIPSTVRFIGYDAFDNCQLKRVDADSIESWCKISFADSKSNPLHSEGFFNYKNKDWINIKDDVYYRSWEYQYRQETNPMLYIDNKPITDVVIPNSVSRIGNFAFNGYTGLRSINMPSSVTSIGCCAFYDCTGLTGVSIPEKVSSIEDDTFYKCSSLTYVNIPNGVKNIGNEAFYGCSALTRINIPDSVKNIGIYAFYSCLSLSNIYIGNGVEQIGTGAFDRTSYLLNNNNWKDYVLYIGNYLIDSKVDLSKTYNVKDKTKTIADSAFSNCEVGRVNFPDSVKYIGSNAFCECNKLTEVNFTDNVIKIGSSAFSNCRKLSKINIPKHLTEIADRTFFNCRSLSDVKIPNSIEIIDDSAFRDCKNISNVIYEGSNSQWDKIRIYPYNEDLTFSNIKFENQTEVEHTHVYISHVTKEASCNQLGVVTYTCSCGDSYTEFLPMTQHIIADDKAVAPTFTKTGKTAGKRCSVCGKIIVAQKTVARLGSPSLSKVTAGKNSFTAQWKKVKSIDGYQIQYSLKSNMKSSKRVTVKGYKNTKKTVKKPKKGKKYYVRIRAYKTINGKKVYSKWSAKKTVKDRKSKINTLI